MATKKTAKKSAQKKQVTPVDDTSKKNKIIAIIIAIVIIVALLLCLTCCNKSTDTKKLQGKVIKESDKKKKKDKKKKQIVTEDNYKPSYFTYTNNKEENNIITLAYNTGSQVVKDTTSPVARVVYSTTEMTKDDVTITIIASEKIKKVYGWILSEDGKSLTKIVDKNESGNITISDLDGNTTNVSYSVNNIDKEGPNLKVSYGVLDDATGDIIDIDITKPTNKDVIVTITSDEKIIEPNDWTLSEDEMSITKKITQSMENKEVLTVTDVLGNPSETTYIVSNIDKEKPIAINNTPSYSPKQLTNQPVTITIEVSEDVTTADTTWTQNGNVFTKTFDVTTTGDLIVTDLAGNTNSIPYSVTIDTTLPTGTASYSKTGPTNQPVTITIEVSEDVTTTDTTWTKNGNIFTKTVNANVTGNLIVTDLAGNTNSIPYSVQNIDMTAPTATVSEDINYILLIFPYSRDITITADEPIIDVTGWTRSADGKTISKNNVSLDTSTVTITDLAGNSTTVTY